MTQRIENIYDKIYKDDSTKKPELFIKIIEPEISFLENTEPTDQNDYLKITRLISDYSLMLSQIREINKSRIYLDKSIRLIENDIQLKEKNLFQESMYEALIANRAVNNYHLRKYKLAENDFTNLTINFPNNKNYKKWLNKIRNRKFRLIEWGFLILIIIGAILSLYFDRNDGILNILSIIILIIGLVGSLTFEIIKRRLKIK